VEAAAAAAISDPLASSLQPPRSGRGRRRNLAAARAAIGGPSVMLPPLRLPLSLSARSNPTGGLGRAESWAARAAARLSHSTDSHSRLSIHNLARSLSLERRAD